MLEDISDLSGHKTPHGKVRQVIPAEAVRPYVFNGKYQYPWHDGWAVRLPLRFDAIFPTHAEAIAHAAREVPTMTNPVIPAQAVEAAAKAAYSVGKIDSGVDWDDLHPTRREVYVEMATHALEAAAPHIRAQTLNDAADRIIGPSEHLRDAATCRDIASELRRERAGCNLNI